jgi:hypothetical protein
MIGYVSLQRLLAAKLAVQLAQELALKERISIRRNAREQRV